jgi:hypothetical protein
MKDVILLIIKKLYQFHIKLGKIKYNSSTLILAKIYLLIYKINFKI